MDLRFFRQVDGTGGLVRAILPDFQRFEGN